MSEPAKPELGRGRGYNLNSSPLRKPGAQNLNLADGSTAKVVDTDKPQSTLLKTDAPEFVPKQAKPIGNIPDGFIEFIEELVWDILCSPDHLENSGKALASYLESNVTTEQALVLASDVVFEWAVSPDNNFAQLVAKLVKYISERLNNVNFNGTFKQHMLKRCHKEHNQRSELVKNNFVRLRAFAFFMAELCLQLGNDKKVKEHLTHALIELLNIILESKQNGFEQTIIEVLNISSNVIDPPLLESLTSKFKSAEFAHLSKLSDKFSSLDISHSGGSMAASSTSKSQLEQLVHVSEFIPKTTPAAHFDQHQNQYIAYIEEALGDMYCNPSAFDKISKDLVTCINHNVVSDEMMHLTCDILFVLTDVNFVYMSARLCKYLDEKLSRRSFLLDMIKRCQMEYDVLKFEDLRQQDKVKAFALFIAELYCSGIDAKCKGTLRTMITKVLNSLLSNLNGGYPRTAVQLLKLCGATLEDDLAAAGFRSEMDRIMELLKQNISSKEFGHLFQSVLNLRASNWGRTDVSDGTANTEMAIDGYSLEPVFFDKEGRQITREQAGFAEPDIDDLDTQSEFSNSEDIPKGSGDYTEDNLTVEAAFSDEEMTDEMFEDFDRYEAELKYRNT